VDAVLGTEAVKAAVVAKVKAKAKRNILNLLIIVVAGVIAFTI